MKRTVMGVIGLSAMGALACAKLPKVEGVETVGASQDHAYYALPRLVAVATFEANVVTVDGDARCRARAGDLDLELKKPGRYFKVTQAALERRTEADPDHWYAVELTGASVKTVGLKVGADGRIAGASASASSNVLPIIGSGLKLIGEVAGKVLFAGARGAAPDDAFCTEQKTLIAGLRKEKRKLLDAGAPPHSSAALELKLARLELAEAEASAHFTGVKVTAPKKFRCEIIPAKTEETWTTETELFRFTQEGITSFAAARCEVPPDLMKEVAASVSKAAGGDPNAAGSPETRVVFRVAKADGVSDVPARLKEKQGNPSGGSFVYRVPASADVWIGERRVTPEKKPKPEEASAGEGEDAVGETVVEGKQLTDKQRWLVPQLGQRLQLSRMKAGGKSKIELEFDPETGALLAIKAEREGADFDKAATSAGEGVKAVLGAKEAADARDRELEDALREKQYWEALAAVHTAKQILEDAPVDPSTK